MKKCPYCAEDIQDAALVCKHCGRDLQTGATPVQVVTAKAKTSPVVLLLAGLIALAFVSLFARACFGPMP